MRIVRLALLAALLALPLAAIAQERPGIEHEMSEAEFKAAGLDKLSATELARLNAWLGRKVAQETSAAVEQAVARASEQEREAGREEGRKEVVEKNRGFFHFGSDEAIESTISGEFSGFGRGRQYRLDNGQVWEQTDSATLAGVRRTSPKVRIKPGAMGAWWLKIDGYNTQAKVRRVE